MICIDAGELCFDRQLLHIITKRPLTNDHVVVPNFIAFINCLLGSLKQVLVLRVKTRDVFSKRQYWAKTEVRQFQTLFETPGLRRFPADFLSNHLSLCIQILRQTSRYRWRNLPSLILLGTGVLFYRKKHNFEKNFVLECLRLS